MYPRIPWDTRSTLGEPLACGFECCGCEQVTTSNRTPVGTPLFKKPKNPFILFTTQYNQEKVTNGCRTVCLTTWKKNLNTVFETLHSSHCANHKNHIPAMTSMRNNSRRRSSRDSWRFEGNPQSITPPGLPPATAASWQVGHPLQQKDITSWFLKCNDYMVPNDELGRMWKEPVVATDYHQNMYMRNRKNH